MLRKSVIAQLTVGLLAALTPAHAAASSLNANTPNAIAPMTVAVTDLCTTPPPPPTNVRASGSLSPTTIMLFWTIVLPSDGCTLAGFDILRAPGASGGIFTDIAHLPVTSSFTDVQLQPTTTYRYQIRSRTTNGLISNPSNTAQATTSDACFPQLPFPPALSVLAVTATSVSLSWSGSNPNCVAFDIQRATGPSSTAFTVIATSSSSRFTDTTVSPGTIYRYRVRARIMTTGLIWGFTNIATVTTPSGIVSAGGPAASSG